MPLHYAKYLKEKKKDFYTASEILKKLVNEGIKHPNILKLLISCYTSFDMPLYDRAYKYVNELYNYLTTKSYVMNKNRNRRILYWMVSINSYTRDTS